MSQLGDSSLPFTFLLKNRVSVKNNEKICATSTCSLTTAVEIGLKIGLKRYCGNTLLWLCCFVCQVPKIRYLTLQYLLHL